MRKNGKTRNFDFIKVAQIYANTDQSEGTATRGLVQGPGAPAGLEVSPLAAGEATRQMGLRSGGLGHVYCSAQCPLAVRTKSLEYF